MARGAAQAQRKRAEAAARPKKRQSAPSWEEQLFFSRLRRHAKVIYVLLAVVFAAGFVVLGVGSGSTGIGDILGNLFKGSSGSSVGSQISDDQKKIAANPNNMEPYLDLSRLYQQQQDTTAATATLKNALKVQPKNLDVLNQLASVYQGQAETARNNAAAAQASLAAENATPPGVDLNSTFGQAFTGDPLSQTLKTQAQTAFTKMATAFQKAEQVYQQLATVSRGTSQEANTQLQLASVAQQALQVTGDPKHAGIALAAYRRYLKLEPQGAQAQIARQTIRQLQAFLPKSQR
jgi:tetratricopeptide (TPR) repeat protein